MLYLIGGTSRSGKSTVARMLLKNAGVAYLPLDAVVVALGRGIPRLRIHDKLFPDTIARRLWPFFKALCESLIYVGNDYVIEGEAMLPVHVRQLIDAFPGQVRCCFMGYPAITQARKLRQLHAHPQKPRDWLLSESPTYVAAHVKHMIAYSQKMQKACAVYAIPYIDVSKNFKGMMQRTTRDLLKR